MKTNGPYPPDMSSCGLLYPLTGVGPELIFGLNVIPKSAFHVSKGEITVVSVKLCKIGGHAHQVYAAFLSCSLRASHSMSMLR